MQPKIDILSCTKEQGKGTGEVRRIVKDEGSRVGNRVRGITSKKQERGKITRRCVRNRSRIGPDSGPYIGTTIRSGISYTEKSR